MDKGNLRALFYFLTLLIVTIFFIVIGIYFINKTSQKNDVSTTRVTEKHQGEINQANDKNIAENDNGLAVDQKYYLQAVKEFEAKNYQTAIDNLNQAITANPKVVYYYTLKSEAEIITGKIDEAKKTLEAGLQQDPTNELLNSKLDALNREYFFPANEEATRG